MYQRNIIALAAFLIIGCVLALSGCTETQDETESITVFSLDNVKSQFNVDITFQKELLNSSVELWNQSNWTKNFFTFPKSGVNGTFNREWKDNTFTAEWDHYILSNLTKMDGNMTIYFNENGTLIHSFHAMDSFIDEYGKTWTFKISLYDIPIDKNTTSNTYKSFIILGNTTCSKIKNISFSEVIPETHPLDTPGTTSINEIRCNSHSSFIVNMFSSD